MRPISIYLSLLLLFAVSLYSYGQDAKEIMKNVDNVLFAPSDKQAKVKIILEKNGGTPKSREAEMKQKGFDKKLYRYTYPESQAGIATLSLPDGIMWLYMPAFGKPKKISLLAKSQAFTGTDFSYEDMTVNSYAKDYKPTLLNTTNEAYVVELEPKSDKSNYSKLVMYVNKSEYFPNKIEYFDKRGRKEKEADFRYQKAGKYWYAEEVTMTDLKKDHSTTILMTEVIFDQKLPDEEFTVEKLVPEEE
jgi:outer membrane lipoprotein-sorting protein